VHYLRLALRCVRMTMHSLTIRGASYLLGLVGQFFVYGAEFLLVWLLVDRFHLIGGWSAPEVLLLFSLNLVSYGLAGTFFFSSVLVLGEHINRGTLDQMLVRPFPALFGLVFFNLNPAYVMHVSLSVAGLVIGLAGSGFTPTPASLALLGLALAGATLIQAALQLVTGAVSFWSNQVGPAVWNIQWSLREFIKFPMTIYPAALQVFLTFVLPVGFMNYYPAARLLGKAPAPFAVLPEVFTPLVGLVLAALAFAVWRAGLRHYESTGS
jgi:ABC-2 type transport system permease protein